MTKKTTEAPKQKKPRAAKKEFMATMREKAEKRLAQLRAKKAKQKNLDNEIAELHRFLGIDSELAARGEQKDMGPPLRPSELATRGLPQENMSDRPGARPGLLDPPTGRGFSFPAADGE